MSNLFDEYKGLVDIMRDDNRGLDEFIDLIRTIRPERLDEIEQLIPTLSRQVYGNKIDTYRQQLQYYRNRVATRSVKSNMMDDEGVSILQRAVEFKRPRIVQYLLDHGADINYMNIRHIRRNDETYDETYRSILSYLVMCNINENSKRGFECRFNATAQLIVDSGLNLRAINLNIFTVKDLIDQIETSKNVKVDGIMEGSFCGNMEQRLRRYFPYLILNEKDCQDLNYLLAPPNEVELDFDDYLLPNVDFTNRIDMILNTFNKCCNHRIFVSLIQTPVGQANKTIRNWSQVTTLLNDEANKYIQDISIKEWAKKITNYLRIMKQYNIIYEQDRCFKFALESFFIDHLKMYVDKKFDEIGIWDNDRYIKPMSYLFHVTTEYEDIPERGFNYQFMEFKKDKLEILLKNNFNIWKRFPKTPWEHAYYYCVDNLNRQEIKGGLGDEGADIEIKKDIFYNKKVECLEMMRVKLMRVKPDWYYSIIPEYHLNQEVDFEYELLGTNLKVSELQNLEIALNSPDKYIVSTICTELTWIIINKTETFVSTGDLFENIDFVMSFEYEQEQVDKYIRILLSKYNENKEVVKRLMNMFVQYQENKIKFNYRSLNGGPSIREIVGENYRLNTWGKYDRIEKQKRIMRSRGGYAKQKRKGDEPDGASTRQEKINKLKNLFRKLKF